MTVMTEDKKQLRDSLVLEEIPVPGYEKVIKVTDQKAGLKAIIAIHNTKMGYALGGTRIYPYPTFEAALTDALRLARGMTYKSSVAETGFGGGKSVIIADPKKDKTEQLLLAFGQAVDQLKGEYICAEDAGSTTQDMMVIKRVTPFVVGLPHEKSSGDPSPFTAWGTFLGVKSVVKKMFNQDSIQGKKIAIQGLGSVGARLAEILFWEGASLILSDIDGGKMETLAKRYGARTCPPEEILSVECDVLAPCAMGGILNVDSIPKLRCKAIAGCANNQLLQDKDADEIMKRGILYAPDFVINAGGLINVTQELELEGYQVKQARDNVTKLYDELMFIYEIAERNRYSTHAAAIALADYHLKYGIGKRRIPLHFHHSNTVLSPKNSSLN
jgi:leucine dehydrogenase